MLGEEAERHPDGALAVDLWALTCGELLERANEFRRSLQPGESARAARFVELQEERRFVLFRGALRLLLGRYLRVPPGEVPLLETGFGKPHVGPGFGRHRLEFNLSHSGDSLVVAISRCGPVGVDVEHVRGGRAIEKLAGRILSPAESREYESLDSSDRELALWRAWTRKEAYLKGVGVGLSERLADVTVTLGASRTPRILSVKGRAEDAGLWRLHEFWPAPDVLGALAVKNAAASPVLFSAEDMTFEDG